MCVRIMVWSFPRTGCDLRTGGAGRMHAHMDADKRRVCAHAHTHTCLPRL